jgi:hypothetical protein
MTTRSCAESGAQTGAELGGVHSGLVSSENSLQIPCLSGILAGWALSVRLGFISGRYLPGPSRPRCPVQLPTKFELVINLKTAKLLGLAILDSILVRADEVIE